MVDLHHSANGAPFREGLDGDLHHRGEALGGQLAQAGKDTSLGRVDLDPDIEEQVHEKHPSVRVDFDHRHLLQSGDQVHLRRYLCQEGVNHPAQAHIRHAGRLVLTDGSGMRREDCGKIFRDFPGPQSLRHRPRWLLGGRVDHGGRRQERPEATEAAAVDGGGS